MTLRTDKIPRIAIDSNVFRNIKFINYLMLHKDEISVTLPSIVQLEIGYFYLAKGLTWNDFLQYCEKFNAKMMEWNTIKIEDVLQNAIAQKNTLPFKEHFRDFIIGTQCEALSCSLITYNTAHFTWLTQTNFWTPEALIVFIEENYTLSSPNDEK